MSLLLFGQEADHEHLTLPYHLDAPIRQLKLDNELDEISGLSIDIDQDCLVAVQDEKGSLFYLNKETGDIIKEVSFWKDGDYEGVELVGEDVFVVKNTGTLYQIKNVGEKDQSVTKYNDFLTSDDDIEGLAYWPQKNKLLLACKAQSGNQLDTVQAKAIYAFDLDSSRFDPVPFLSVNRPLIAHYLQHCPPGPDHTKICDLFDISKDEFGLKPAAAAIHPITEQLYVLSSKGNLLFVVDMQGKVLHITKLPKSLHRQPEGICFDKQGTMYISNEKRKEHEANIVVYSFIPE